MTNFLAYIDPMSGAMVLQLVIAGIAGFMTFFRRSIVGSCKSLLGKKSNSEPTN